jgi:hypothetical protein
VSKKRRGIGGGSGAGGSQPSSSRRDRGLAVDFKESQVRGASIFLCLVYTLQVAQCMLVWRIEYCLTAVVPN